MPVGSYYTKSSTKRPTNQATSGQRIPCLSTWYKLINAGYAGVMYGQKAERPKASPKNLCA